MYPPGMVILASVVLALVVALVAYYFYRAFTR